MTNNLQMSTGSHLQQEQGSRGPSSLLSLTGVAQEAVSQQSQSQQQDVGGNLMTNNPQSTPQQQVQVQSLPQIGGGILSMNTSSQPKSNQRVRFQDQDESQSSTLKEAGVDLPPSLPSRRVSGDHSPGCDFSNAITAAANLLQKNIPSGYIQSPTRPNVARPSPKVAQAIQSADSASLNRRDNTPSPLAPQTRDQEELHASFSEDEDEDDSPSHLPLYSDGNNGKLFPAGSDGDRRRTGLMENLSSSIESSPAVQERGERSAADSPGFRPQLPHRNARPSQIGEEPDLSPGSQHPASTTRSEPGASSRAAQNASPTPSDDSTAQEAQAPADDLDESTFAEETLNYFRSALLLSQLVKKKSSLAQTIRELDVKINNATSNLSYKVVDRKHHTYRPREHMSELPELALDVVQKWGGEGGHGGWRGAQDQKWAGVSERFIDGETAYTRGEVEGEGPGDREARYREEDRLNREAAGELENEDEEGDMPGINFRFEDAGGPLPEPHGTKKKTNVAGGATAAGEELGRGKRKRNKKKRRRSRRAHEPAFEAGGMGGSGEVGGVQANGSPRGGRNRKLGRPGSRLSSRPQTDTAQHGGDEVADADTSEVQELQDEVQAEPEAQVEAAAVPRQEVQQDDIRQQPQQPETKRKISTPQSFRYA